MAKTEYAVTVTVKRVGSDAAGHTYALKQVRTSKGGLPVYVGTGDDKSPIKPYGGLYLDPKAMNGNGKGKSK